MSWKGRGVVDLVGERKFYTSTIPLTSMSIPHQERFIRGKTHVETVYLTLLDKVLTTPQHSWDLFLELFIDYVYKSVVIPEVIRDKTGQYGKLFRTLVERAFRWKVRGLDTYPTFEGEGDPYEICVDFLSKNMRKLFSEEAIRRGVANRAIASICREVIYTATMAFLQELKLIR